MNLKGVSKGGGGISRGSVRGGGGGSVGGQCFVLTPWKSLHPDQLPLDKEICTLFICTLYIVYNPYALLAFLNHIKFLLSFWAHLLLLCLLQPTQCIVSLHNYIISFISGFPLLASFNLVNVQCNKMKQN